MKAIFIFMMLALSNCLYTQLPAYVPVTGLRGFWTFCNNANDVSGNGNNGTVTGATLTTDRFNAAGNAYSFNGTSNYISTNMTGILGNNARAVSVWAKTTESASAMCSVSWGFEQSAPNAGVRYECGFNCDPNNVSIVGSDCCVSYSTPGSTFNNAWHHYIYQFAGGGSGTLNQVQIYQDGVLLTSVIFSYYPNVILNTLNNWPVNFGRIPYVLPHYFKGSLDEIGIWDRVLTVSEIQQLYGGTSFCGQTPTGLTEAEVENAGPEIYPNPNNGNFTVKANGHIDLLIMNTLGQTIYQTKQSPNGNVEIKDLSEGIYFVSGQTEHGKFRNKIVVCK